MSLRTPTTPTRRFLGWDRPALLTAAQDLSDRAEEGELDLSALVVVTPGNRAGRVLNAILSRMAREHRWLYTPPTFATPGRLPGLLFPLSGVAASHCVESLAWVAVLRAADALQPLVPLPPAQDDHHAWNRYGELLSQTAQLLAGENLRPAEVPDAAARSSMPLGDAPDRQRWNRLEQVLSRVQALLTSHDLQLESQAQLVQVRTGVAAVPRTVVLVAVTELAGLARAALMRSGWSIEAIIPAPAAQQDRFDDLGCVLPHMWNAELAAVPDEDIVYAETPSHQAEAAFAALASITPTPDAAQIVISAPDEDITARLHTLAAEVGGVRIRDAAATSAADSTPGVLLELLAGFLAARSMDAMLALLRHPHMEWCLARRLRKAAPRMKHDTRWWLRVLAEYGEKYAPARVDGQWLETHAATRNLLDLFYSNFVSILQPLFASPAARPLGQWIAPLREVLRAIYQSRTLRMTSRAGRRTARALAALARSLDAIEHIPASLQPADSNAAQALLATLAELGHEQLPPEPASDAIEVVGWLDAAIDPSPIAVFTGMNEGIVPERVVQHPLLAESLRIALGIAHNGSRYGRDAYLLALASHSRRGAGSRLVCICGRHSAQRDHLLPSRLLLPPSRQVARLKAILSHGHPTSMRVRRQHMPAGTNRFHVMPTMPAPAVDSLRVTDFGAFMDSAYTFYITRVLGCNEESPPALELGPPQFGMLVHEALARFGRSEKKDSAQVSEIHAALTEAFDACVQEQCGTAPRPEVRLQIENARRRLGAIAEIEAQRRKEGWRIEHTEWAPEGSAIDFVVDDQPMRIRGRIDRIDRNAAQDRWEIIDYKTSDAAHSPDSTHLRGRSGEWVDLQLPLYQLLAAGLLKGATPQLSYLTLPRDPAGTQLRSLTAPDLAGAFERAREVIRDIRNGNFRDGGTSRAEGSLGALLGIGFRVPPPIKAPEASEGAGGDA